MGTRLEDLMIIICNIRLGIKSHFSLRILKGVIKINVDPPRVFGIFRVC